MTAGAEVTVNAVNLGLGLAGLAGGIGGLTTSLGNVGPPGSDVAGGFGADAGGSLIPGLSNAGGGGFFSPVLMAQANVAGGGVMSDATPDFGIRSRPSWLNEPGLESPTIDPLDIIFGIGGITRAAIKLAARTPINITLKGLTHVFQFHTLEGVAHIR